jgi:hypothetical protein
MKVEESGMEGTTDLFSGSFEITPWQAFTEAHVTGEIANT